MPYFGFDTINLSADTAAQVNLGNGNLLVTSNDGVLNGPALAVRNDRFYNGLSPSAGSFGGGWSSPLSAADVGLKVTSSTATFSGPTGFTAVFTRSGTSWVAPAGFRATLVDGQYTRTLTYNQTGEQYVFNLNGWITKNLNRNGKGTTFTYDVSSQQVTTVTEASGRSYSIMWQSIGGVDVISSITDSAGRVTTYTANASGQLTRVDAPAGFFEQYTYDSVGRLATIVTIGTGSASTNTLVQFGYDSSSRVSSVKRGLNSTPTVFLSTSSYTYTSGQTTVTDGRGKTATFTIDTAGRVTTATDALGRSRSKTWTANSDVATSTDALGTGPGNTTTFAYDALNNAVGVALPTGAAASAAYATGVGCTGTGGTTFQPKCSTDSAGAGKAFTYDAKGNPTKVTDTTTGGTGSVPQQFTYENSGSVCGGFDGQVCTTKDGNNNTISYAYDADGNLTSVTPPSPQGGTTYTYDSLGRVLTVTDGNNATSTYAYNVRDEIVSSTFQGGQTFITQYFGNGLKSKDTDSTGPTAYFYFDALGRTRKQVEVVTATRTMDFTYDAASNITSFDDSSNYLTSYVYDDANQLVQILETGGVCPTGTGSPASSGCIKISYNANGAETLRTLPGNATVTTVNDASSRPTRITAKDTAGVVKVDIGFSYTAVGGTGATADRVTIQTRTSYLETGITAGAVTSYTYDSLNRLKTAIEKNGATASASWAYTYDAAGNRTAQTRTGSTGSAAGTVTYTYNAANRLASTNTDTTTWTYDGAGNQTRNGQTAQTAAYNSRGAVTAIGATSYTAYGQGNTQQLTSSNSSTTFQNSPLGLIGENLGGPSRAFTRTPDGQALSTRLSGGSRYYYAQDSLGSVVGMFDKTGVYLGGYSYSPYGETRAVSTGSALTTNHLRYISGYYDTGSGLYKLGARYYDPSIGRFTQYDPSGQETNPYGYAGCNPINAKDPSGLSPCSDLKLFQNAAAGFTYGAGVVAGIAGVTGAAPVAAVAVGVGISTGAGALIAGYIYDGTCS
ncbi:RHS repeat-associated core domain-containing protein [Cryobacterium sp. PH29-G1]|uniref:RHS repeat-associated core domain-containing protein n=1 Tax=Cryobacterium sp. PH29-G1 TaxID=3046211 RepID=UPI0024B91A7C|nr:RHS repeat-associated core domain-containing protein [Cryobacterium sp. PH29-G1]MDJ0348394.1 RHS repeat-associated core domain-containing protein [Cryobacterium sp. PH29-G1]